MSYSSGGQYGTAVGAAISNRMAFVQKVYGVFLLGILASVGAAGVMCGSPAGQQAFHGHTVPVLVEWAVGANWLLVIAFFALFFIARACRRMPGLNLVMLLGFCASAGAMIAPQLWLYSVTSPGTVSMAGALTTLMFVGLTAYAMITGKNFSYLGAGLFVALLGLIGGSILNGLFFGSAWTDYLFAWGALVIFSGFVLYDTQRIVRDLPDSEYIVGALELYLDFINLFLAILRILNGRR